MRVAVIVAKEEEKRSKTTKIGQEIDKRLFDEFRQAGFDPLKSVEYVLGLDR